MNVIEISLAFYGSFGFFVTDKCLTSNGARACFVEGLGTRLEFVEYSTVVNGIVTSLIGFDRLVFLVTRACTDLDIYLAHWRKLNGGILTVRSDGLQHEKCKIFLIIDQVYLLPMFVHLPKIVSAPHLSAEKTVPQN